MKTLDAAMTAHINGTVTTLATCWMVTLTDGEVLYLTDHDSDVVFDGNTYQASTAMTRTAVQSRGDLSVDNLEVAGVLNEVIEEADLRDGRYDFATIEIFSVNWTDPDGFGKLPHRLGWLGEIKLTGDKYEVEMRGLTQILERRRGAHYTADCRADLYSPLVNVVTNRASGCGVSQAAYKEESQVAAVLSNREFTVPILKTQTLDSDYDTSPATTEKTRVWVDSNGAVRMQLDEEDGMPLRPIEVANPTDLNNIRNNEYGYYVLTADIDMSSYGEWIPINKFCGILDGRGHRIFGLDMNRVTPGTPNNNTAFIRYLFGTVKNLGFIECVVNTNDAGASWPCIIATIAYGGTSQAYPNKVVGSIIQNCWCIGGYVDGASTKGAPILGLSNGNSPKTRIINCWTAIEIRNEGSFTGAIGGQCTGATVQDCYFNSDAAGTTDPGTGITLDVEAFGMTDAEWIVQSNYNQGTPGAFEFTDKLIMNVGAVTGSPDFTFDEDGNPDTITRSAGSWLTDGFRAHEQITVTGSTSNNGTYTMRSVTATVITLDTTDALTDEGPTSAPTITSAGCPRILDPGRF